MINKKITSLLKNKFNIDLENKDGINPNTENLEDTSSDGCTGCSECGAKFDDWEGREILINGDINDTTIERYVMPIIIMNKEDDAKGLKVEDREPIILYINCVGGDITHGNCLVDIIKASKTPVIGVVLSFAYSMAVPILLACDVRLAYSNSTFVIHDGVLALENSGSKFKDQFKFIMKQEEKLKNFIVENTNISRKQLEKNWKNEWYFDSADALNMGVIDEIITEII